MLSNPPTPPDMDASALGDHYRRYIAIMNSHDLSAAALEPFVHDDVTLNGASFSRQAYSDRCQRALADPASHIDIDGMIAQDAGLAVRLKFACKTPAGESTPGLVIRGRLVTAEHAIYHFEAGRIKTVWTIVESQPVDPARRFVLCASYVIHVLILLDQGLLRTEYVLGSVVPSHHALHDSTSRQCSRDIAHFPC